MALALDGTPAHANAGSSSSLGVTLSTTNTNDIICVVVTTNGGPVTGISDDDALSWSKRVAVSTGGSGDDDLEFWTAVASSALSSDIITVQTTTSQYLTIDAFGISGADISTIFDANAALPDTVTDNTHAVISTDTADTFLIGAYRLTAANPTEGIGWTKISGKHFQLVEYKIVSSTQSALDVDIGTEDGNSNAGIGDAIIIESGAPTYAIYKGSTKLSAIYKGSTALTAAYKGSTRIF